MTRQTIPESPEHPFPITIESTPILSGFGRGSSDLGTPTANVALDEKLKNLDTGIYFGFCQLSTNTEHKVPGEQKPELEFNFGENLKSGSESDVPLPMVMSVGYNPFYHDKQKSAELYILHKFGGSFYGALVKFNILGYIRPELDYTTKDALIKDIEIDTETAKNALSKPGYAKYQSL